ncbi:cytochrome P450 [Phytohabitans rumicis]|uniref:cytochrome P450 n=1 Tax=Phytohabitans rumicis TaxID=1076125 RepID=UPI0031EABECC
MKPPDHPFDPYSAHVQRDPYPHYADLRDTAPVVRCVLDGREVYVLSRDRDVRAALADWETFSSRGGLSLHPRPRHEAGVIIASDPRRPGDPPGVPDHGDLIRAVAGHFSPRAIARLSGPVRAWAHSLVGDLVSAGSFDTVAALARVVPTRVVGDLVGLPEADRYQYADWAAAAMSLQGPDSVIAPHVADRLGAMREHVTQLGTNGGLALAGVGAAVFSAADNDGPLTRQDAISIVWGALIVAGLHTTVAALTWALLAAATYPYQWDRYRNWHRSGDPARLAWTDELLRYESIFPLGYRTTTTVAKVDGYVIPARSRVLILYGAANRDPARWPAADQFVVGRHGVGQHLGLGDGTHRCIGQHLARLETTAVLDAFAAHGVCGFSPVEQQAVWEPNAAVRGWSRFPMTVTLREANHAARI